MLAEIQGIHILLKRWVENPEAPASEVSPFTADRDKDPPFTREEIARKVAFLRKHAPGLRDLAHLAGRDNSGDPAVFCTTGFSGDVSAAELRGRHTGASGAPAN